MSVVQANLLPEAWMRRVEHRRQARRWMPIWLAVAALLALAQFGLRFRTGQAESALLSLTEWTAQPRQSTAVRVSR